MIMPLNPQYYCYAGLIGMIPSVFAAPSLPPRTLAAAWHFPNPLYQIKKETFWWQFRLAPDNLRAYFQEAYGNTGLSNNAWIESTALIQYPFQDQQQSYLFVLFKNQPVSQQIFSEAITGWLSGLLFKWEQNQWQVIATGQALGWLTQQPFAPQHFQLIQLGTQQIGFLCQVDLSPHPQEQQHRAYLIVQEHNQLKQIGIIPLVDKRFSDEINAFITEKSVISVIKPLAKQFSPLQVIVHTHFHTKKHTAPKKEIRLYHYLTQEGFYFSQ